MEHHWFFKFQDSDYGFDPRSSRIKDLGEHSIKTFVREFIQNSLDVRFDKSRPVEIEFFISRMSDESVIGLKKNLGEAFLAMFKNSYEKAELDEKEKLRLGYEILFENRVGYALTINEKNCLGLTGPERIQGKGERSNFDALLRKVNTNVKENSNSGGTWGKGSSIYTYSSLIRTWFAYSILSTDWNGQKKRFIGRSQLAPFIDYGDNSTKAYHGDGSFCRKEEDKSKVGLPVVNEHADVLAAQFNMSPRSDKDFGTSFFIPAFNPNLENATSSLIIEEFRKQILLNWFITIYEGKLVVKLSDGVMTTTIDKLYLDSVAPLKYKLEILDWYIRNKPSDSRFFINAIKLDVPALKEAFHKEKNISFASAQQQVTVDLVIRKLEDFETHQDDWKTLNKVALVRGENAMLVSNHSVNLSFLHEQKVRTESILFVGLAARGKTENEKRHSDLFFAYAENPDHSEWCTEESKMNSLSYLERFAEVERATKGRKVKSTKIINDLLYNDLIQSFKVFFQENKDIETTNQINQLFQKLAALKNTGEAKPKDNLISIRRNPRHDYPEIDHNGKFQYHLILRVLKEGARTEITFKAALESWEGEVFDFEELGVPEFESIEVFSYDSKTIMSAGSDPTISLKSSDQDFKISIQTCPIVGKRSFQNLQPRIKILVKEMST